MLLNSAVLFLYYVRQLQIHKKEMKEYIAASKNFYSGLLTIFAPGDDFRLVNRDEISSKGRMYDIVKKDTVNSQTVYYAVTDDKEDTLISVITNLTKQFPESGQRQGRKLSLQILKFVSNCNNLLFPQLPCNLHEKYVYTDPHYSSADKTVLAPPPKPMRS